jgi:hydroxypyruvate reductase
MPQQPAQLREDALRIWRAGVEAVLPANLMPEVVSVSGDTLWIADEELDLRQIERIAVVGAGKAGAGMAVALETALLPRVLQEKQVHGWVNVPEDCLQPTAIVHLHVARPAGANLPTSQGVEGTEAILRIVSQLGPRDLCLVLISGGGSALLPAPVEGCSLDTKATLAQEIAARGGNIRQLNTVRRELSRVKGGGLAHACRAGRLMGLILSDVLGDDLELIASGPTVARKPTPEAALQVLAELGLQDHTAGREASRVLQLRAADKKTLQPLHCRVSNHIIANNATAVDAAGVEAERLGYSHVMLSSRDAEGSAEEVAGRIVEMAQRMRGEDGPDCLIWGGEPTVTLCEPAVRGRGGRNQQLALAALLGLTDWSGLALVAGGTDGEDGPTNAAGAIADAEILAEAHRLGLDGRDYLRRNDAYRFFDAVGGLLRTGTTHTNVCDVRVLTLGR